VSTILEVSHSQDCEVPQDCRGLLVRAASPPRPVGERGGLGRRRNTGLLLGVLQHIERHPGRARIRTDRFFGKLSDRLALGDLAAHAVDGDNHRIVDRLNR
jgi:hypothetical protein